MIFVENTVPILWKQLNRELSWNAMLKSWIELWIELRQILMVELNSESSLDAMSIFKNWIWIESKHFVWIEIESWIQKSWIVTSLQKRYLFSLLSISNLHHKSILSLMNGILPWVKSQLDTGHRHTESLLCYIRYT